MIIGHNLQFAKGHNHLWSQPVMIDHSITGHELLMTGYKPVIASVCALKTHSKKLVQ